MSTINADELSLLAYMHEHAEGYTAEFPIDIDATMQTLGVDQKHFIKDLSYLVDQQFAGWNAIDTSTYEGRSFEMESFWLTSRGENYIRDVESQPGFAKKITVGVVKEGWGLLKGIAADVLKNYMTGAG